jgi:adenosylcobinamide-phosphate synthase
LGVVFYVVGCAVLLSTTFAVSGLVRAARNVQAAMDAGSVNEARRGLESLVSRDANSLSRPLVAAAAIESVAENTTDSYIGPWLSFAILGLPGAFAYRAINTLDSMIGYRGKYEYLGKASARLDDAINFVPSRLSAAFMVASGALCGMPARMGWAWAWRGHVQTASPNAGWTIGAMSGLLGVALEKPGHYRIGDGLRDPCASHIGTSIRVAYAVAALGLLTALGALTVRGLLTG